jgi:hypothetical protein
VTSALDEFEAKLVEASRTLHAGSQAPAPPPRRPRRRLLLRRLRQASLVAQLAVAVGSFSALGGAATGAYLWLTSNSPGTRELPRLECTISTQGATTNGAALIVTTITGDPLVDCRTALTQAQGHRPPSLTAWGNSFQTAVVRPTASGPPPYPGPWHRLAPGWTVDLRVVELNDQLNDISAGMADGPACTFPGRAVGIARSLLVADGLHGWHVSLHANNGPLVSGCRHIAPNVDATKREVELIQIQDLGRPEHVPALQRRRQREYARALATLLTLQVRTNRTLATRCTTVAGAAQLWRREAKAAGFVAATPAFWRAVQSLGQAPGKGVPALPRGFFRHYTLVRQPASQHTGACARLLIQDDGGDELIVYAARMAP